MPGARSLQTLYKFHIEGEPGSDGQPVAQVYFKDLVLQVDPKAADKPAEESLLQYNGMQVLLIKESDFSTAVDTTKFCTWKGQFIAANAPKTFTNFTIRAEIGSHSDPVLTAGTYILVISNCGTLKGLSVKGFVAVQHPWGYLPALEKGSKSFYMVCMGIYGFALFCWTLVCLKWWGQLFVLQKGLWLTLVFCFSESIAWWLFFQVRNDTGDFPRLVFLFAALSSIYKLVTSFYAITSSPAKGADADAGLSLGLHSLLMLYLVFQFHFKVIECLRHGFAITSTVVIVSALPVAIVGTILMVVAFRKISGYVDDLKNERDVPDKVKLYQRLQGLLCFASLAGACAMLLDVFDPTANSMENWKMHPLVADGLPQGIFGIVMLCMMLIAFPTSELQGYTYVPQVQQGETMGAPASIWDDDDDEEIANPTEGKKLVAVE
eukprot:CAMPEP_0206451954 /NCGR_PEP_ID=MMETSP0324_2-20121206/19653_1 /ASSEMBLY_ACC=CAM_ASM_000836 /TAXON_ID=2866 /ORGANISM="Crypthecodinium cohnii, Strain Seligo" /LENGTH=434 /DNA_ID=CAMNT_0053921943 /DNA_START=259 /DNA_END=1563 /DNA_ORIENTATION=+